MHAERRLAPRRPPFWLVQPHGHGRYRVKSIRIFQMALGRCHPPRRGTKNNDSPSNSDAVSCQSGICVDSKADKHHADRDVGQPSPIQINRYKSNQKREGTNADSGGSDAQSSSRAVEAHSLAPFRGEEAISFFETRQPLGSSSIRS